MAEEETEQDELEAPKSNMPMMMIGGVALIAIVAVVMVFMMGGDGGPAKIEVVPPAEYVVKDKMYQMKDGSYLKLSFSIVVDMDKISQVANIIEKESPSRLPDGINMILGNKTRAELISGTHKREAFVRELKKTIEERVFGEYNRQQVSSESIINVREILINDFVTQPG